MGLESGTFINDLVATNPVGASDQKNEGDDHLRLIKSVLQATLADMAGRLSRVQEKTSEYTVVATDNTTVIVATGAGGWDLILTAAATLGNGHYFLLYNNTSGVITIDPDGAELINGAATLDVGVGFMAPVYCDGTKFLTAQLSIAAVAASFKHASYTQNLGLETSVATNILTVELKGKNLSDPSGTNTVGIAYRSETLATGDYDVVETTAALSIDIPVGATLGFEDLEEGFIYLYMLNNAGANELAVAKQALFDEGTRHSTTLIDSGADSANVLYSATARADVPIRLIGRIRVLAGATAGDWSNAPTEETIWQPGMKQTGNIVQVVNVLDGAVATGTTIIPWDDTIPQNTEGDEYMTLAITPRATPNKLKIEVEVNFGYSVGAEAICALFQDSIANALTVASVKPFTANGSGQIYLLHYMPAGTVSETTFKVHIGPRLAGTITFNGVSAGRLFGGVHLSSITITEIQA